MAAKKGTTRANKPTANTEAAAVQVTQTAAQATAETAAAPAVETATETTTPEKPAPPEEASSKKGTTGWVVATLKTRHCEGGVCKEAGEQMRLTRGTYERLKKYGRVE
ncbi:hypothetical protein VE30_02015 [Vreelandella aquamarina]|uniref:hypothetical protein n=1 Tax=Vreelandella aquamarina TaxID=77097 RepID=UPI0005CC1665|nr:hypothetical protein [Halomonas meridiana]KJD20520.1 hypothetical protein VE30_02015 [Halomonas meridiana]